MKIAVEFGDRNGEGGGYGNLGNAYQSLGDYRIAIEYYETQLKIAIEIVDRAGREEPMEFLVILISHWVTIGKPPSIMKNV